MNCHSFPLQSSWILYAQQPPCQGLPILAPYTTSRDIGKCCQGWQPYLEKHGSINVLLSLNPTTLIKNIRYYWTLLQLEEKKISIKYGHCCRVPRLQCLSHGYSGGGEFRAVWVWPDCYSVPGTSLLGIMVLFRKDHFILLWQSKLMLALTPAGSLFHHTNLPLPILSREHLWTSGAERDSGKNSTALSAEATAPTRSSWQEIIVLCCLGLGAGKCSPRELHHHIAFVPKCVRAVGRNDHRLRLSGETTQGWPAQNSRHPGFVYSGEYHFVG